MDEKKKFVAGFCIKGFTISQIENHLEAFHTLRRLRKVGFDFLDNDGIPFYDGDKKLLITGSDSSVEMLTKTLNKKPKLVIYPAWLEKVKNLALARFYFFNFAKKQNIWYNIFKLNLNLN